MANARASLCTIGRAVRRRLVVVSTRRKKGTDVRRNDWRSQDEDGVVVQMSKTREGRHRS